MSFESHFHNGSPLQSSSTGGLDNDLCNPARMVITILLTGKP